MGYRIAVPEAAEIIRPARPREQNRTIIIGALSHMHSLLTMCAYAVLVRASAQPCRRGFIVHIRLCIHLRVREPPHCRKPDAETDRFDGYPTITARIFYVATLRGKAIQP